MSEFDDPPKFNFYIAITFYWLMYIQDFNRNIVPWSYFLQSDKLENCLELYTVCVYKVVCMPV